MTTLAALGRRGERITTEEAGNRSVRRRRRDMVGRTGEEEEGGRSQRGKEGRERRTLVEMERGRAGEEEEEGGTSHEGMIGTETVMAGGEEEEVSVSGMMIGGRGTSFRETIVTVTVMEEDVDVVLPKTRSGEGRSLAGMIVTETAGGEGGVVLPEMRSGEQRRSLVEMIGMIGEGGVAGRKSGGPRMSHAGTTVRGIRMAAGEGEGGEKEMNPVGTIAMNGEVGVVAGKTSGDRGTSLVGMTETATAGEVGVVLPAGGVGTTALARGTMEIVLEGGVKGGAGRMRRGRGGRGKIGGILEVEGNVMGSGGGRIEEGVGVGG